MSSNDPNQKTLSQYFHEDADAASLMKIRNSTRPNNIRINETIYNGSFTQNTAILLATSNSVITNQNHQSNTNSDPNQTTMTQYFCSDISNLNDNNIAFSDRLSINEADYSVQAKDYQGASDRSIGNNSNGNSSVFVDELSINGSDDDLISVTNSHDSQETVFYDTSFLTQRSFETTDE